MERNMLKLSVMRSPSSRLKRQVLVLVWVMVAVVVRGQPPIKCPEECRCHWYYCPEHGPSQHAECLQGGMQAIPVDRLEKTINQLRVIPPLDNPNFLTIGPILTQPRPFSKLRELTIANSNVPSIGQYSFWGLQNLKTLNLTRNNITRLEPENFRGLISLFSLHLDYNQIEQMPSETFRHLTSLDLLSLTHNQISSLVPRLFRMLANLTTLDLSYNPLNDLNPEVFKDIQHLMILKCRQCQLSHINGQIYHLAPLIEELDLGENFIKFLVRDEFSDLPKLKKLQLDRNQVSVIVDNVFGQNREMITLELAHNRLVLLTSGSLINLTNLQNLDISYNKLSKFVLQAFATVVNSLNSIDFSGNILPLKEIAVVLQILPKLKTIRMSNLSLTDIPPNFFMHNQHLNELDISSNELTRFPYNLLRKIKMLHNLDISKNKIQTLSKQDLNRLEAISVINLSENAWHCDLCSVETMLVFLKTSVLNGSLRHLNCTTPLRLQGARLAELTTEMLEPCSMSYEAKLSIIAGLVLVSVVVLALMLTALYWTHYRGAEDFEDKRRERNHDHPEELLAHEPQGSVATINAPYQQVPNCS